MNKLYRLPLRTRNKNLSNGVRRRQNSSKIVATGILALCGLAALVAIGCGLAWGLINGLLVFNGLAELPRHRLAD